MLYAQLSKDVWGTALPASWDKAQSMFDYLHKMTYGYQITFETRMIYSVIDPAFRCSLIRWGENRANGNEPRQREVLLETSDPAQMEAALTMLISEAEIAHRAARPKRSMVP